MRPSKISVDKLLLGDASQTVGPVPNRDAQTASFKAKILDMLET